MREPLFDETYRTPVRIVDVHEARDLSRDLACEETEWSDCPGQFVPCTSVKINAPASRRERIGTAGEQAGDPKRIVIVWGTPI